MGWGWLGTCATSLSWPCRGRDRRGSPCPGSRADTPSALCPFPTAQPHRWWPCRRWGPRRWRPRCPARSLGPRARRGRAVRPLSIQTAAHFASDRWSTGGPERGCVERGAWQGWRGDGSGDGVVAAGIARSRTGWTAPGAAVKRTAQNHRVATPLVLPGPSRAPPTRCRRRLSRPNRKSMPSCSSTVIAMGR